MREWDGEPTTTVEAAYAAAEDELVDAMGDVPQEAVLRAERWLDGLRTKHAAGRLDAGRAIEEFQSFDIDDFRAEVASR